MKTNATSFILPTLLGILVHLAALQPASSCAQVYGAAPMPMPLPLPNGLSSRDTQRNALQAVQGELKWFRSATRTAPNLVTGAYDTLFGRFVQLRTHYNAFRNSLTPGQMNQGANELAELGAGLDIIQEAFDDFQAAASAGQANRTTFNHMCRVLDEAVGVWGRELDRVSRRLRVGW